MDQDGHRVWQMLVAATLVLAVVVLLAACGNGQDDPAPTAESGGGVEATTAPGPEAPAQAPTAPPASPLPADTPTPTPVPTPTPPAPLAALVNGQYLFLSDYESQVTRFEQALVEQGLDPGTEEGQAYLVQARTDVLESLIDLMLIEQGGLALGVTIGEQELEAQLEADIEAGGGQAAFEEWLEATGQTRDDYRQLLRQAMLSQQVLEVVTAGVSAEGEQVHARHISTDSEAEAREIRTQLQGGADFAELARQYSLDTITSDAGGDLGWFPRGVVAQELEDAAFALQPGELSEPVPMGGGYHIVLVVERETVRPLAPDVLMQLQQTSFQRWLEEQRAAAAIERFVGE